MVEEPLACIGGVGVERSAVEPLSACISGAGVERPTVGHLPELVFNSCIMFLIDINSAFIILFSDIISEMNLFSRAATVGK